MSYTLKDWSSAAGGDPGAAIRSALSEVEARLSGYTDDAVGYTASAAVADSFYVDGVATSSSTTFTSATASFTSLDVGKSVMILKAGSSTEQDLHTTIASVQNSTTVVLSHGAGRSQSQCRFYISRSGDQTTTIQAEIDALAAAGGGTLWFGPGGFLITGLVLKNRVMLQGAGRRATVLHLAASSNAPVVRNDYTVNNSAHNCGVRDMWLDGNRARQSDCTTTLASSYTAGGTSLALTDASSFFPSGEVLIGSNRFTYQSKSTNTLTSAVGGRENTTDASHSAGVTVTQHLAGIYFATDPFNSGGTYEETYDPHYIIDNVLVKNVKGDGISIWGQSEALIDNAWVSYTDHHGYRSAFDSYLVNCSAEKCGRAGFYFGWSEIKAIGCKSYYSGNSVTADGFGFFCEAPTTLEEGTKVLAACSAQDNKADGFYLRNTQRVILQGTASSNGTSSAGTYVGVRADGITNCIIDVCCTERAAAATQSSALYLLGTSITPAKNNIRLTHEWATGAGSTSGTISTAIKSGSVLTGGSTITVGGSGGGAVAAAYAATVTPDPYVAKTLSVGALTNNVTIAAPTNAHQGCELTVILKQDGTGGRTVTWNAAYVNTPTTATTAAAYTVGRFVYDGTNWVGV